THQAQDLQALFARVHAIVEGLLPARNFCIALYDADSDLLSYPYYVDERHPAPTPGPLAPHAPCARVIREAKPLLVSPDNPAPELTELANGAPLYWLGVPLCTPEK